MISIKISVKFLININLSVKSFTLLEPDRDNNWPGAKIFWEPRLDKKNFDGLLFLLISIFWTQFPKYQIPPDFQKKSHIPKKNRLMTLIIYFCLLKICYNPKR